MAKFTKNNLFNVYDSKPETPMDKTTRVVRQKFSTKKRNNDKLRIPDCAMLALKEKRARHPIPKPQQHANLVARKPLQSGN